MGRLSRASIKRLERSSRSGLTAIKLRDGTVERFSPKQFRQALTSAINQITGQPDATIHPVNLAASNAADPNWRNGSIFGVHRIVDRQGDTVGEILDLSEQKAGSD